MVVPSRAIFIPIRPRLSVFYRCRFLSGAKMPLPSTDILYVFAMKLPRDGFQTGLREQAPLSLIKC